MHLFEPAKPIFVRAQLLWTAMWAACTGIGLYLKPDIHGHGTHQQLGLPPCPSVLLFDRPCPGCGLTTSWTNFLHGHVIEAFKCHPLGVPMYLAFTFVALASLYGNFKGKRLLIDSPKANTAFVSFVVVFFVFGGIRMALEPGFSGTSKEMAYRSLMAHARAQAPAVPDQKN
ncbi:MAG: DUF2752 domain-containing protein [Armatimonadetes bacterium]|nr:DUF2752 domain-containing protein [Armatimonadota bacterium]MBS1703473.1 DUF2752 domain-containing protein [Armatimonadota bacterium]MBS1727218.1 DUF2752 domain-containing protein [Armatimonadota bacterium]